MDVSALGQACDEFCAIRDQNARVRDPFRKWLTQYRHNGIFELTLYANKHEGGYMSQGSAEKINWVPGDGVYHGYPSERPGGAQNYRYDVPMDAYPPNSHRDD